MVYARNDVTIGEELTQTYFVSVEDLEMQIFIIKKGNNKRQSIDPLLAKQM